MHRAGRDRLISRSLLLPNHHRPYMWSAAHGPAFRDMSVPTPVVPSKSVPFSKDELEAILTSMTHAAWLMYGVNQPSVYLDKSLWSHIADDLHSRGWPRRTWQQIKAKGKQLVMSTPAVGKPPSDSQLVHPGSPYSSDQNVLCENTSVVNCRPPETSPLRSKSGLKSPQMLPTLTPAPSLMPHSQNTPPTGPQILRVQSTSQSGGLLSVPTQTGNLISGPQICPASCLPVFEQNAKQSSPCFTPPLLSGYPSTLLVSQVPAHRMGYPPDAMASSNSFCNSGVSPAFQTSPRLPAVDQMVPTPLLPLKYQHQLRINALKLEILELKKEYWSKKLK
ncbi:unnamed protein product [Dicrocoelium dendriticum]|nr:unnamed protein product [Dicrocoelium dendriticum]